MSQKTKKTTKSTKGAKKATGKKPQTMADLLENLDQPLVVPKKGEVVKGTIKAKNKRSLTIDIGAKTEAIVNDREFDFAQDFIKDLKVGDEIEGVVISSENDRGQVILSLKGAATEAKWQFFQEALDEEKELAAKALEVNKGGLIVEINGVRGFVPSSQFSRKYLGKLRELKGKTIKVKAIEVDQEKNRLIFSERHVSEAEELALRDQAVKKVKEGEVYEGVVSGVMHFGLFVTVEIPVNKDKIGYAEGLVHISEISWEKVNHPKDYHQTGDRIKVKVLGVDDKTNKLNLSIKQLKADPWETAAEKYLPGTTFTGKVSRLESFGVFVNVEPGVDGLIHATNLKGQTLAVDDEVTVNVESIEPEQRRMSLSLVPTEVPMGYK
ncbi:MAG: S1 RNA-binding domain-containing protein [Candidatus Pacebacteria bacterium]|nr:S1 RNA-binding domain-containing protein [Candidatus Paceibacterota bacterium]